MRRSLARSAGIAGLRPWLAAMVAAALPHAAAAPSPQFPSSGGHVRWVGSAQHAQQEAGPLAGSTPACAFEAVDAMLRVEPGVVRCAERMSILVRAPVAAVRAALQQAPGLRRMQFEDTPGNALFGSSDWQPLLLARRPDLRRQIVTQRLRDPLAEAARQGSFAPAQLARIEAEALASHDAAFNDIVALPERDLPLPGVTARLRRGNPQENEGSGTLEQVQVHDASSFFGPGTSVVSLYRLEVQREWARRGGFLQLPFPLDLQRIGLKRQFVPRALFDEVLGALGPLAGAEGLRTSDTPARDWMSAPAAPPQGPLIAATTDGASIPEFHRFEGEGFVYAGDLLALPDGSLLAAGENWGRQEANVASVQRLRPGASGALRHEAAWRSADEALRGVRHLRMGWAHDVWWTARTPESRDGDLQTDQVFRWAFDTADAQQWTVQRPATARDWLLDAQAGPLFPNREALYGRGRGEAAPALLGAAADDWRTAAQVPTAIALSPRVPVPTAQRLQTLQTAFRQVLEAQSLRVRDADRHWWLDRYLFSTDARTGRIRSDATHARPIDCRSMRCLGSREAGWLAHAGTRTLPVDASGAPDRAVIEALDRHEPDWQQRAFDPQRRYRDIAGALMQRRVPFARFASLEFYGLADGDHRAAVLLPGDGARAMARSAHGRWLAAVSPDGGRQAAVLVDVEGLQVLQARLPEGAGRVDALAFSWDGATLWGLTRRGLIAWPLAGATRDAARGTAVPDQVRR